MASEKKEKHVTPVGFAKWAFVHKVKPSQFADKDPKFQIEVYFDPNDAAWKDWASKVMADFRALPDQFAKNPETGIKEVIKKRPPIKREVDAAEQPTGRMYISLSTGEKFPPRVFDKTGQPIPATVAIGNESKVRVSYIQNAYEGFGGGINFYLNAVQVLDLVEYQAGSAKDYGFDVEAPAAGSGGSSHDDGLPF